jgi:hypothetical protein
MEVKVIRVNLPAIVKPPVHPPQYPLADTYHALGYRLIGWAKALHYAIHYDHRHWWLFLRHQDRDRDHMFMRLTCGKERGWRRHGPFPSAHQALAALDNEGFTPASGAQATLGSILKAQLGRKPTRPVIAYAAGRHWAAGTIEYASPDLESEANHGNSR